MTNLKDEKETTALIQSNSVETDIKSDISNLNINLSAQNSMDEIVKNATPNHARFHTSLGIPNTNEIDKILKLIQ